MSAQNSFPYFTSGNSASEFTVLPSQGGSQSAAIGLEGKGVRLTQPLGGQNGGVVLEHLNFSTAKGFVVSFEYEMSSPLVGSFGGGDGMTMVLYDGSVANPTLGAFGSGLGYAYRETNTTGGKIPGFSKGYLAVGLDYYGSFHRRANQPSESRNGINYGDGAKSFITIRGPYDPNNDKRGYHPINPPAGSNRYLDFASFRFKVYDTSIRQYVPTPKHHEHAIAGLGTFRYVNNGDVSSHVEFTPDPVVVASGNYPTEAVVHYDIKNINPMIGTDEYRSNTSKITMRFNPKKQKKYLIINGDYRNRE